MKTLNNTVILSNALLATAMAAQPSHEFHVQDAVEAVNADYTFSNTRDSVSSEIIEQEILSENFIEDWTSKNEKRFDELVVLIHTGQATSEDRAKMSLLRKIRRQKKSRRTAEEMIAQIERENAREKLKQALLEYVEIFGANKKA